MEEKIEQVITHFKAYHNQDPEKVVSCGGRFEILGNHTDHNHGLCIASACNLEVIAAIATNHTDIVRLKSIGFPEDEVDLNKLEINEDEFGSSTALIRGVAAYLDKEGYKVGGFNAYTNSSIFKGAGVSSSAAFELLVGHIFNVLFNNGKIPTLVLCRAGQYAENEYFGKKSGLLDQIGVAFGGIIKIDFKDINNPLIERISFPFTDLHFVLVNTGGDHSSLSDLYSSIPLDMYEVANEMRKHFLSECTLEELENVKYNLDNSKYLRAKHFFSENERVTKAFKALIEKDEAAFLKAINESRESSTNNLKNMMVEGHYEGSPLEACDLIMKASENEGAVKINGGGFAGSVIAVIPTKHLDKVIKTASKKYGEKNVCEIFVRQDGPKTLYNLK